MGEGAGMSPDELAEAVRTVIEAVGGSLPVLGGIIADSSAEAVRLAHALRKAGAQGVQVPPLIFTCQPAPRFGRVLPRDHGRCPNSTSHIQVMPTAQAAVESLQELIADNPAIVGIKQSGRNIHTLALC